MKHELSCDVVVVGGGPGGASTALAACLFSLNPILKFDGYWVVADALGVSNLSQLPPLLFGRLWGLIRRRPMPALPWPTPILWLLAIYSLANIVFWVWFISVIAGKVVLLINSLPSLVISIWQPIVAGSFPESGALVDLATSLFMLIFVGMMGAQLGSRLFRLLFKGMQAIWRAFR